MSAKTPHHEDLHWHEHYDRNFSWFDYFGNMNAHRALLWSVLRERPRRVLEVGAGSGTMSVFLSYFTKEALALDNNEKVLAQCRYHNEKFKGSARFVKGDAFKMPFPAQHFDVAFSQGLLEHFGVKDIIKILDEQLRVARVVVFSVPNSDYHDESVGHENRWSRESWEHILKKYRQRQSVNYGRAALSCFLNKPGQYLAKIEARW